MAYEYHKPILTKEVLDGLAECIQRIVVDATAGGLGHSTEIAKRLPAGGVLVCIDKDAESLGSGLAVGGERFAECDTIFVQDDFANIKRILAEHGIGEVDAVVADLGVSSHQIDTAERGFSYTKDGPLDMRMDRGQKRDAAHVVNNYSEERLVEIIKTYGEERFAKRIAAAIVRGRPVGSTMQLAKIITEAVPGNYYKTGGHPAKRTFQAIRIEVNRELESLEIFIRDAVGALRPGGRIAVITCHSLEDRIVKQAFRFLAAECVCPPKTPVCICGHKATLRVLTKKPILPCAAEVRDNPRAASAKLRLGERI